MERRPIIGFVGLARSGKNTAATFLKNEWNYKTQLSFAGPLKAAAKELFSLNETEVQGENGYDREQPHPFWGRSVRDILQTLGTEGVRDIFGEDHFVRLMDKKLEQFSNGWSESGAVITDVRFDNEVELIKKHGGVIIGLVRGGDTPDVRPHSSEEMAAERLHDVSDIVIVAEHVNELYAGLVATMGRQVDEAPRS